MRPEQVGGGEVAERRVRRQALREQGEAAAPVDRVGQLHPAVVRQVQPVGALATAASGAQPSGLRGGDDVGCLHTSTVAPGAGARPPSAPSVDGAGRCGRRPAGRAPLCYGLPPLLIIVRCRWDTPVIGVSHLPMTMINRAGGGAGVGEEGSGGGVQAGELLVRQLDVGGGR
ncbi:hypothetical protein GCM10011381_32680 [Klenkia taihuensis]|nr:hypothetical protein GCM10011381_32680 [Klenkia taihuensis]